MIWWWRCLVSLMLLSGVAVRAETIATATSPSQQITVSLAINGEGRVSYSVDRMGKPVIGESQLGFLFTDAPQLLRNFRLVSQATTEFDESWTQP